MSQSLFANGAYGILLIKLPPAVQTLYEEFKDAIDPKSLCVKVEYDHDFRGGDYDGTGQFAYVPLRLIDRQPSKDQDERLKSAFRRHTIGIDPVHIIHYTFDESYTQDGVMIEPDDDLDSEKLYEMALSWSAKFVAAFKAAGIVVPVEAELLPTGTEDEHAGRCATSPDLWVLGFGLFQLPGNYPALHPSFVEAAEWHTWVTYG